ncbi:MAG: SET domain-containing protein-lysine N-methyltransferase [Desulfobacterales bacterium]|nr:SET domain-containing protein-lysine N-methyltransferase [Desulfobacterales bacterium]
MKRATRKTYRTREDIRSFFKSQGLIYLERTRIDWQPLRSMTLDQSPYYLENLAYFLQLCRTYGEMIRQGAKAPIDIRRIDDSVGFGVYATQNIDKDAFIGEYAGVVQLADADAGRALDAGGFESDYAWYYLDDVPDAPDLEINGRLEGNELRFVNHSDSPNVEVEHTLFEGQWIILFTAARDIKKDEQLLISYGEAYWEDGWRDLKSI